MTATRSRRAEIASAITALATLLLLLIGVPLVLAALAGWPLPRVLPSPAQIRDALDNGWAPSATFVLKTVAFVAWLAWVQIAISVITEIVSALRGRSARTVWLGGWAQPIAARLVATAMLLHTLAASAAQPSALPALATATVATAAPAAALPKPVLASVASLQDEADLPIYGIQRHDTLWDIAQRHLGDPLRWREVFDLNRDRVQADGRRLTDPDRIYPGWNLLLPADATNLGVTPATAPAVPSPAAPPSTAPAATLPAPSASPAPTIAETPQPSSVTAPPPVTDVGVGKRSEHHAFPVRDVGLPLLAAGGLVITLDQTRRRRQRQRRPGQVPPPPPAGTEAVERKARAAAADQPAEWADAALRYLAAQLARRSEPAPTIVGVRPGNLGVEILLGAAAAEAPDGFTSADDGMVWRLDDRLDLEALEPTSDGMSAPCPALVTLGNTADGPVLIDLEHLGVLLVDGDTYRCATFLAGVVLEAATAPWAGLNKVIHAGADDDKLNRVENVEHTSDLQKTAEEAQGFATSTENDLATRPSTFAARVEAAWADAWEANVVVVPGQGANPEALATLVRTAKPHRSGVAVVTTADIPDPRWRLTFDGDGNGVLEEQQDQTESAGSDRPRPVRIVVRSTVDAEAVAGAAELLANAAEPPVDESEEPDTSPVANADRLEVVEPEVEVRVLGPIEVDGLSQQTNRKKVIEAIVYLALHHDHPVPSDTLRCALWPLDGAGNEVVYSTFKQAMSRARSTLGTDSVGERHLPDAHGGSYQLGPRVGSDWEQFRTLAREARSLPSSEAIETLRAAMTLVRGAPLAGVAPGSYAWAWSEQTITDIEVAITDAAVQLAELSLESADWETADWAARQGLKVVPGHEGLQQVRIRAAHVTGSADAVDRAYRDARRTAEALDPLDGVSDETVALYRQLKGEIERCAPTNGNGRNSNPLTGDSEEQRGSP